MGLRSTISTLCMLAPWFTTADAQIRASERSTVSQTIDGTVITVDYARPQLRGRTGVFGRTVRDTVWTPGANWATTFEFSKPVRLNGQEVPAGRYSIWMRPRPGDWVLYLHQNPRLFHTQHPKPHEMFLSLKVEADSGSEPVDVLTFDFPRVDRDGATLRFRWERTVVPLEIKVTPSRAAAGLSNEQLEPYLGSYELAWDSAGPTMKAELINADGVLKGIFDFGQESMVVEFLPTGTPHRFQPSFTYQGITDVEEVPAIFQMEGGRAVGFVILGVAPPDAPPGSEPPVWLRAKRKS
jgi:hypothetical protein